MHIFVEWTKIFGGSESVEQEHKRRDWELLRIFVFLAVLTLGLVTALRWVVMTPVPSPSLNKAKIIEPQVEKSDRTPAEN